MELGRFGHHPDPAVDFEVEVDVLEGAVADWKAGLEERSDVERRIFMAMMFRVGGVDRAVIAKNKLRALEAEVHG